MCKVIKKECFHHKLMYPFVLCSFDLNTILQAEKRDLAAMRRKAKDADECAALCYMKLRTTFSRIIFTLWL